MEGSAGVVESVEGMLDELDKLIGWTEHGDMSGFEQCAVGGKVAISLGFETVGLTVLLPWSSVGVF